MLQFIGIFVIGVGFILHFPSLISYKLLGIGVIFFCMGWIVEKFGLK